MPLKRLAEDLGSSTATVQRRIQALMQARVIERTVAIVNPVKVSHPLMVVVLVRMAKSGSTMQHRFERLMASQPQVMSCYEISGDYDFMLMVANPDMHAYHQFTRQFLTSDNNVAHFNSQFVMNAVKASTKITLEEL